MEYNSSTSSTISAISPCAPSSIQPEAGFLSTETTHSSTASQSQPASGSFSFEQRDRLCEAQTDIKHPDDRHNRRKRRPRAHEPAATTVSAEQASDTGHSDNSLGGEASLVGGGLPNGSALQCSICGDVALGYGE